MVPLFSAEGLSSLLFLVIVITTVLGAVIATHSERLIRAVTGLAISSIGLSGLYYYLNSPFVAQFHPQTSQVINQLCPVFISNGRDSLEFNNNLVEAHDIRFILLPLLQFPSLFRQHQ